MLIEENKPLAPFTTFAIGGPARWFVQATSEDEIVAATALAAERSLPLFVLGGGSNLLISDAGFDGLVLHIGLRGISATESTDRADRLYQAAAGEDWDRFVERTVIDNCSGIECLAGIPGTVGGTPVQNVGAYGQEVSASIQCVRAYDLHTRAFVELPASECCFAYRRSRFNTVDRGRYIVTRVDYRLTLNGPPTVRYADLQRALAEQGIEGREPNLIEVAAQVRRIRQTKGMLLVESDPDCKSAGSFFKNPVVSEEQFQQIAATGEAAPPRFPAGPEPENQNLVKIPAAWLIEHSGFAKGCTLGAAAISSRHTLALTNRGSATASEVLALAAQITTAVEARFKIHLEIEPVMVGF
jgi:UDP-N-acetylmuramate dehydrogenase